ncbi:hypothetical protein ABIC08_009315 [Bradyrhizobium sp. RT9b]
MIVARSFLVRWASSIISTFAYAFASECFSSVVRKASVTAAMHSPLARKIRRGRMARSEAVA